MTARHQIRVDLDQRQVWIDNKPVAVKAKVFDMLALFVNNPGRLLTKALILRQVWPETHVSDGSVKDCVRSLRSVLQDNAAQPSIIETVRGHGYRYLGGIELGPGAGPASAAPPVPAPAPSRPRRFAALIALVLLAGLVLWPKQQPAPRFEPARGAAMAFPLPDVPSVAVRGFTPLSAGPETGLFAAGLTADMKTSLAALPDLFVSARSSPAGSDPKTQTVAQVAEALGVRYLLEGDVQKTGAQLRITARLVDALAGTYAWSGRYDIPARDLFAVQDQIVMQVLLNLRLTLAPGEKDRRVTDTENLASWLASTEAYAEFLSFTAISNARARALWQDSLQHDPARAVPHAGLAFTHYRDAWQGWAADRDAAIARGLHHADMALQRAPDLPLGHQAKGALLILRGDRETGLALRRKAVALGPSDFTAIGGLASFLTGMGQPGEAVPLFRRAVRLNPEPPLWVPVWFGHALSLSGHHREAETWLQSALSRAPDRADIHALLAVLYAEMGRLPEARARARHVLQLDPGFTADNLRRMFWLDPATVPASFNRALARAGLPG